MRKMDMKIKGNILFVLAASLITFTAIKSYSSAPGFIELPANDPEHKYYIEARKKSLLYILRSSSKLPPARNIFERAYNALRNAKFYVSTNADSENRCAVNNNAGFFVNFKEYPGIIFICQGIRTTVQGKPSPLFQDRLSQLFIHESAHLAGEDDECFSTRFEMNVMIETVKIKTDGNLHRYAPQCGSQFDNYWSHVPEEAKERSTHLQI